MQVTVCGGGNAAHTLTGLLGSREELSVRVYAPFGDEAERWQAGVEENKGIIVQTPEHTLVGRPDIISRDPRVAVAGSQIILLALPAFAHATILTQIAPHIPPGAWVGALPARGGFDLAAQEAFKSRLSDIVLFGFQTLPWACRIREFGRLAAILGTKAEVDLAALPQDQAPVISGHLSVLLGVAINPISCFLSLTLADTGQIIHPGIMYGLFHNWTGQVYSQACLFYQSIDASTAALLQEMSAEIQALRAALEDRYPGIDLSAVRPLGSWLRRSYRNSIADDSTLQSCFTTNRSYAGLLAPMKPTGQGFIPDFKGRYLSEDVPYNLIVARGIAELAGMKMPTIDLVLAWAQSRLGKEYLVDGKLQGADLIETRSPQRYGFNNLEQFIRGMGYGMAGKDLAHLSAGSAGDPT